MNKEMRRIKKIVAMIVLVAFLVQAGPVYALDSIDIGTDLLQQTEMADSETMSQTEDIVAEKDLPQSSSDVSISDDTGKNFNSEINLPQLFSDGENFIGTEVCPESPCEGELVDKRESNVKYFQNEDSTVTACSYPCNVHYLDENGSYLDIDNTLESALDGELTEVLKNRKNSFSVKFAKKPKENKLVRLEIGDAKVSWGLVGIDNRSVIRQSDLPLPALFDGQEKDPRILDNISSSVEYNNILQNTDLKYDTVGTDVKEYIILKSADVPSSFRFYYATHKSKLKETDEGIVITDLNGTVISKMAPMVMSDDNLNVSNDINVTLTTVKESGNGGEYQITITPSAAWLQRSDCAYPVTIDPTINVAQNSTAVKANFISSSYPDTVQSFTDYFQLGTNGSAYRYMTLIRPVIPSEIGFNVRVTHAEFSAMARNGHFSQMAASSSPPVFEAHMLTSAWDENTVTWNKVEANHEITYDNRIVDYEKPCAKDGVSAEERWYTWDITQTMNQWFEGSKYHGILLKTPDGYNGTNSIARFYSPSYADYTQLRPVFSFTYVSMIGMEDYWTYHSQEAGLAGQGYVNDFTGNLTTSFNDVVLDSAKMPFSLDHVFSGYNCGKVQPTLNVGKGFQLSVQETVTPVKIGSEQKYRYVDGDGTEHYFEKGSDNIWRDDSGLSYTLTITDATYTITDKKDNKRNFSRAIEYDGSACLSTLVDNHGNTVTLNYTNKQLRSVTDASGRVIRFTADANNRLTKITLPDNKVISFEYISGSSYSDQNGCLNRVTFPGTSEVNTGIGGTANVATFGYTIGGCINQLTDEAKQMSVCYDVQYTGNSRRVAGYRIQTTSGQVKSSYAIEYNYYNTKFTEVTPATGRNEIYSFNELGHTVSAVDQDGNAIFTETGMSGGAKNKVTFASKTQRYTKNYLKNHNCESAGSFNITAGAGTDRFVAFKTNSGSDIAFNGKGMLKVFKTYPTNDQVYASQTVTVPGGTKYTFSVFVKTAFEKVSDGGAFIKVSGPSGVTTVSKTNIISSEYSRQQVTVDLSGISGNANVTVTVGSNSANGAAYFDCFQLEQGSCANQYNLVENGDFDTGNLNYWKGVSLNPYNDNGDSVETHTKHSGGYAFQFYGSPLHKKLIENTVNVSVKSGEGIVYGVWVKSGGIPNKDVKQDGSAQSVGITIELSNGTNKQYSNKLITPTDRQWLYISGSCIANADYNQLKVSLKCNYNANFTYFDDLTVFKDSFGESFNYDAKGNVVSVVDMAKNTESITTDGNNDLKTYKDGIGNVYNLEYNNGDSASKKHELTKCTAPDSTYTKISYDIYGNAQYSGIFSPNSTDLAIRADSIYKYNGTYLDYTVDQQKVKTTYDYSLNDGLLRSVSDPGNADEKTYYAYDGATDKLTGVTHTSINNAVHYGYSKERTAYVDNGGFRYNYAYDALGNLLSVGTGNSVDNLESYHYDSRNLMDRATFGNGQTLNYTFDQQERTTAIQQDDATIATFDYNAHGLLGNATYYSEGTPVSNQYQYDFAERYVSSYNTKGFGTDAITYDKNNNNTGYNAFLKRNSVNLSYATAYTYNNVNNPRWLTVVNDSSTDYSYDKYGRSSGTYVNTVGNTATNGLWTGCTYKTVDERYTTKLLQQYRVRFSSQQNTGNPDYTYDYTYDNSGNITTANRTLKSGAVSSATYRYDQLNQLTEANNCGGSGLRETFGYDVRGNLFKRATYSGSSLKSKTEYNYDTTSNLDELKSFKVYNASDVLTKSKDYTYDNAGNPTEIVVTSGSVTTTYTLGWEQGKKLKSYSGGGVNNAYCYNESGLVSKVTKADGSTVEYYYDDDTLEYEEYRNSAGNVTRIHKYFYDSEGNVSYLLTKTKDFTNSGNYNLYAYVYDGAGAITDLIRLRAEGASVSAAAFTQAVHYEYDAYGKPLSVTNKLSNGENISQWNPIRYKGYYYETETGYYRLDSRSYDPETGRFLNADDISVLSESPNSLTDKNLYSYCDNNPIMRKDNAGDFWVLAIPAIPAIVESIAYTVSVVGLVTYAACDIYNNYITFSYSKHKNDPYARPGQHKQGRENKYKAKNKDNWKLRKTPKKLKKHTPSPKHRGGKLSKQKKFKRKNK